MDELYLPKNRLISSSTRNNRNNSTTSGTTTTNSTTSGIGGSCSTTGSDGNGDSENIGIGAGNKADNTDHTADTVSCYDLSVELPMWHSVLLFINSLRVNRIEINTNTINNTTSNNVNNVNSIGGRTAQSSISSTSYTAGNGSGSGNGNGNGKKKRNKATSINSRGTNTNTITSTGSNRVPIVGTNTYSSNCVAPDVYLGELIRKFRISMNPMHTNHTTIGKSSTHTNSNTGTSGSFLFTPTNKQEDAMEFLTFLLDVLHEESLALVGNSGGSGGGDSGNSGDSGSGSNDTAGVVAVGDGTIVSGEVELGLETVGQGQDETTETTESADTDETNESEDGWTEVRKCSTGSGVKMNGIKVVIDTKTRESTTREVASSLIGLLFHGILRSEVVYSRKHMSSVTFQKFHCITLNVDRISIPPNDDNRVTKRPITPHYLQYAGSPHPTGGSGTHGVGYNQSCRLEDAFVNYFKEEKVSCIYMCVLVYVLLCVSMYKY